MSSVAIDNLRRRLAGRVSPALFREFGWLAAGFASKFAIQIGTLYYLTRTLDLSGMGLFYSLVSLFACLVPFVQLGNYDLTIRQVAQGEDPRVVAGRAMRGSVAMFVVLLPVLLLLRAWIAPEVAWRVYLAVASGELLVMRITSNVQAVATGFRKHYVVAVSDFLLGLSRFAAIFAAHRMNASIDVVLLLYAFTSLPAAIVAWAWMHRSVGAPLLRGGPMLADVRDHLRMVVAWFAEMAAREGDKPLLKAFSNSAQAGVFGTATRLFSVALVPIDLFTQVMRPRVGRAFAEGSAAGNAMHRRLLMALGALGTLVGVGLFAVAALAPRLVPRLAGSELDQVRVALMLLSIVPPIYGLQRANIIVAISRGATGAYAAATVTSATAGLLTLVTFAPRFGWRAACAASIVYLAISCATSWLFMSIGERRRSSAIEAESALDARSLEIGAAL